MLLEIMEGQGAYISAEKLRDNNYFMYPAYYNALLALINIVKQCQHWKERRDGQNCRELEEYGVTNIIAFAAPRGGGKTSAMRSFAAAMEHPENFLDSGLEGGEALDGAAFLPLPLIAPSVLRPGQGILPVVLSRMYRLAEELWKEKTKQNGGGLSFGKGPSELEKSELLHQFQKCLSGINTIKSADGTTMDLSRLHEISDGASLCQSFYELVQRMLRFADCPNGFLVLQIDDADSQVGQGYQMLEDIRKYLMIPNLIILMAADFSMLRAVVLKHHCAEFSYTQEIVDLLELRSLTGKYLDKLIPPLNLVYLPELEQYSVRYGDNLSLRYLRDREVLWECGANVSFQSQVLAQIYRRTGLAFVSHASYQNNIIPTTLRGLKQLLEILAHMPEIPEVAAASQRSTTALARQVRHQAEIARENLARFSDYFIQDWISVKIFEEKDRRFLRNLIHSPTADRLQLIRNYLEERRKEEKIAFTCPAGDYSHAAITQCIEEASMKSRRKGDYLFFFALRTILSLDAHRRVWLQKERAAVQCEKENGKLLVFHLDPEIIGVSDTYYISSKHRDLKGSELLISLEKAIRALSDWTSKDVALADALFAQRGEMMSLSYMQILNLFLNLGHPALRQYVSGQSGGLDRAAARHHQAVLYNAQEVALFVSANWEVQRRLLVDWDLMQTQQMSAKRADSPRANNMAAIVRDIFDRMDEELQNLNERTLWPTDPSKSLGGAFRALCFGDIFDDLDFERFYSDLCDRLAKR